MAKQNTLNKDIQMQANAIEMTHDEIQMVFGGDRGEATVAGGLSVGLAVGKWGSGVLRGASWGARLGAFAGPLGAVGGFLIGGAAGALSTFVVYTYTN